MQIRAIVLYGPDNERREVRFALGTVNIITGASKRGKSSLLDIVEYCLGADECNVAPGYISQTVSWYSILLAFPDTDVFIARAAPLAHRKSNSACHLIVENSIEIPERHELYESSNVDGVTSFLTAKLGIPEQTTEVPDQRTRSPITITLKHSRHYLFQGQDEVAARRTLFHRQAEPYIPQAIKDTLPYFMGAAEDDRLSDLARQRELKRRKVRLVRRINEIESLTGEGTDKGFELLAEAASVGLDDGTIPSSGEELFERLSSIARWNPHDPEPDEDLDDPLYRLEHEYKQLTEEKRTARARLNAASEFGASISGFEGELDEQATRLKSVGLFEALESGTVCPLCEHEHGEASPAVIMMQKALASLDEKLVGVSRSKPRIQGYVSDLREDYHRVTSQIRKTRDSLNRLRTKRNLQQVDAGLDADRLRLAGRVSLYLESTQSADDTALLKQELEEIETELADLEKKLDPKTLQDRLDAQLSLISEDMTKWARELRLEHSEYPIRLDVKALTVVSETPDGRIPLYKMGSGENWVGYHLVSYLALAKWFIRQSRPVGRFIFFDQPTQVYFPSDSSVTGDLSEIENDEDREAVKRMFSWIFRVVEELKPNLQVIITDHADIGEEWFQDAIIDSKWRGDNALIPRHWYSPS